MMIRSSFIAVHTLNNYLQIPTKSNSNTQSLLSLPIPRNLPSFSSLNLASSKPLRCSSSSSSSTMDSSSTSSSIDTNEELAYDLPPIMKVYKNGRVERLAGEDVVPPSLDPVTNVESKDVVISEDEGISARLFLPKSITENQTTKNKLPLFVYFHGGAFCIETPFSANYHNFLNSVISKAGAVGVSVHYRRAPEHPVNIAHYLGVWVGSEGLPGLKIEGIVLVHPYFWGSERIGSEAYQTEAAEKVDGLWRFSCPTTSGSDDPIINPDKDPNVGKLACERVLVLVAEKDLLRDRGFFYKEVLEKNGWGGVAQVVEAKDEGHVFHMFKPTCENAMLLLNQVVSFINQD
ncbi:probable carboxylesterase 2 [Arachis ipaensis]|uniref:probable carboxylesterase 2 n=1 Tax=Arachis ipaensis TaxID=130454 RepID=UPI0007AF21FC|nr:probable carboxylesterase 2 [Arachis ipaensis]